MGRQWELPLGKKKKRCSWPATLLAAFILSSCFLVTQAEKKIPISVEPLHPLTDQKVALILGKHVKHRSTSTCRWYRGSNKTENMLLEYGFDEDSRIIDSSTVSNKQRDGQAYTGRESVSVNCALYIRNLLLSDAGLYTLVIERSGEVKQGGHVFLEVSDSPDLETIRPDLPDSDEDNDFYDYLQTTAPMPDFDVQDPSHLKLPLEIIWTIILGSLAVTTVLEILLYFLLRACYQRNRNPKAIISAAPEHEMIPSSAKKLKYGDEDV